MFSACCVGLYGHVEATTLRCFLLCATNTSDHFSETNTFEHAESESLAFRSVVNLGDSMVAPAQSMVEESFLFQDGIGVLVGLGSKNTWVPPTFRVFLISFDWFLLPTPPPALGLLTWRQSLGEPKPHLPRSWA